MSGLVIVRVTVRARTFSRANKVDVSEFNRRLIYRTIVFYIGY